MQPTTAVIVVGALWWCGQEAMTRPAAGGSCNVSKYNFTAQVEDGAGRQCRMHLSINACYGACMTMEYGTEDFPHVVGTYDRCLHDEVKDTVYTFSDCDDDFDETMKTYTIQEAVSCKCKTCDSSTTKCLTKKSERQPTKFTRDPDGLAGFDDLDAFEELTAFW